MRTRQHTLVKVLPASVSLMFLIAIVVSKQCEYIHKSGAIVAFKVYNTISSTLNKKIAPSKPFYHLDTFSADFSYISFRKRISFLY